MTTSSRSTPHQDVDTAQIANPASVYWEEQGNRLEIRTADNGSQYGTCVFPDGSECDEWAFFRHECGPQDQGISTPGHEPSPTLPPTTISPVTARSLERLYILTGHTGRVAELAFSSDGAYLASANLDHTIRVWDVKSGMEVSSFPIRKPDLNVITFSPIGIFWHRTK